MLLTGGKRNSQVYSYTPRALSFVPQSTFGPKVDRTHDRRRPGVDPLASKVAWPNTKWYVKDSLFLPPLTTGSASVRQANRRYHLRYRLWHATAGMGRNRLSAWSLPCHYSTYEAWRKKTWSFSFHLFVTFYNPFRSSSVPILWSVSGKYESNCSLHHSPAVTYAIRP